MKWLPALYAVLSLGACTQNPQPPCPAGVACPKCPEPSQHPLTQEKARHLDNDLARAQKQLEELQQR